MDVAERLRVLEASLLTPAVRKNAVRVAELLADEFREFGRSGTVYTKAEILSFLQEEEAFEIAMKDFVCRPVAEGVALEIGRAHV